MYKHQIFWRRAICMACSLGTALWTARIHHTAQSGHASTAAFIFEKTANIHNAYYGHHMICLVRVTSCSKGKTLIQYIHNNYVESSHLPVVLYDDRCSLCTSFARCVNFFAKGTVRLVGHYSEQGTDLRGSILDHDALEMFWFVDENTAFGGRAALLPLIKRILSNIGRRSAQAPSSQPVTECHNSDCSTVKYVFIRSASLLRRSRTIQYAKG